MPERTFSPSPILSCQGLIFGPDPRQPVLRGLDMALFSGEALILRGPSGSGKSTLLRLLCNLMEPQAGTILLHGLSIADMPPPEVRRRILYLQQQPTLLDASVRDNLLLPLRLAANRQRPAPADDVLAYRLRAMGLQTVSLDAPALQLSVGQRQRLCLLRAMLLQPDVLLLDEPTAALDPGNAAAVLQAVAAVHAAGTACILVAHGELPLPAGMPIRTATLEDGRLQS